VSAEGHERPENQLINKIMKKLLSLTLALVALVAFVSGCDKNASSGGGTGTNPPAAPK
jgi:hypothetical protein